MHDDVDATTLSLEEITGLLQRDSTQLDRAERELAAARQAYEDGIARNPHADLPDVRARLEAQYGGPVRDAEDATAKLARKVGDRARAVMTATQAAQLVLTDDEWRAAETRRETIREDVEMLSAAKLIEMTQFAVLKNDRPSMYHLHRYVPNRIAAGERQGDDGRLSRLTEREKSELRRLVSAIADKLKDPALAPVQEQARDLLGRAGKVQYGASERLRKEERARVPFAFQSEHDVKRW